jgi:hypothetical protein
LANLQKPAEGQIKNPFLKPPVAKRPRKHNVRSKSAPKPRPEDIANLDGSDEPPELVKMIEEQFTPD